MDLAAIAANYDITDIVHGLRGSKRAKYGLCPLHQDHEPSFSVFWEGSRQLWKCWGSCAKGGDVIDLIGYMYVADYNRKDKKKLEAAVERLTGEKQSVVLTPPPAKPPMLPQWLWKEMLPPSRRVLEYALSRGLKADQVVKYRIGTPNKFMKNEPYNIYDPESWMSIPTFHSDELVGIKLRNITDRGIRYMSMPGSRKGLFNYNNVYGISQPVLVVKGEIAAMVADRFGFLACAPTGGEGSNVDDIRRALAFADVIVVGDNDLKPDTREKMQEYARKRAALFNGRAVFPPERFKDIDEFLLAEGDRAVETIKGWFG